MSATETLKAAIGNALAAPGIRHGLRWFIQNEHLPQAWRDIAHRKLAKRARFDARSTFTYRTRHDRELRFAFKGTSSYLYWREAYERETLTVFSTLARQTTAAILDIGAADGIYAILAAAENPSARIVAFEPVDTAACGINIALNQPLTQNVSHESIALGDVDAEQTLYVAGSGGTSSLNPAFRRYHRELVVSVRRADAVLNDLGIPRVGLIKMDTESTEPAVLRGMADTLERDRPDIVCEVLAGRTERALEQLLAPLRYRYYQLTEDGAVARSSIAGDPTYRYPNYLFSVVEPAELVRRGIRVIS